MLGVELLVANGHRLQDVLTYSLRRIDLFATYLEKRQKRELVSLSVAIRASQGEGKQFKEWTDRMEGD
jgi:hypothetical protein